MNGQMTLDEWMESKEHPHVGDCTECYCQSCLYWWSSRCTYGIIDERGYERHYSEKSIGKTVFLTREEAEKKLEEMKKNE